MGTINVTVANQSLVYVSVNQDTRIVTLQGKAPGTTTLTITDSRGLTRTVPVRVAYFAGSIASYATLRLTGDPASAEYIKKEAADLVRSLATARDGAQIVVGSDDVDVRAPLDQDDIVTVNVPPIKRMELENWLWKTKKIRIRGGEPSKLRLSTPYYLMKADVDRYLAAFDEFKTMNRS